MHVLVGLGIFVRGIFEGITSIAVRFFVWVSDGDGLAVLVGGTVGIGNSTSVSLVDIKAGIWSED
jgi:hypothetical protein